jgi:phosphoribosyl 1,2-cyclic phosphate phosphodiesterase
MKVTILGSGTSAGVPVLGKNTPVNLSTDPKDKRTRASIIIQSKINLIVDTGPDFRMQLLTNGIDDIQHVLYTHSHYDHIGGLDDLRPLCFKYEDGISCYSDDYTYAEIASRYQYFYDPEDYFGKPQINFFKLKTDEAGVFKSFHIDDIEIQPVKMIHVELKKIYSVGYIFNEKLAYLTDFREILPEYIPLLENLDYAIIGAPLPVPHPNHLSIYEASDLAIKLNVKKAFITHLADRKFHTELEKELPMHIQPAYDGLTFEI